jgi:hypothetical protein
MALALSSAAVTSALAQYPGEPAIPDRTWDPVRDMNDIREWGMPDETVRQAQQVLHDQGYYDGPIDGVVKSPAYLNTCVSSCCLPPHRTSNPPDFGRRPSHQEELDDEPERES